MALKFEIQNKGSSTGGKVAATFFCGIFLAMGLAFSALVAGEFQKAAATYTWEEQRCIVTASQVHRTGGESPYQARVDFRLADGGFLGANNHLRYDDPKDSSWDKARRRIGNFPVDAIVPCYVSHSGEAVLTRGPLWIGAGLLFTMIFVLIGAIGLWATWRPVRRDHLGAALPEPIAPGATSQRVAGGVPWVAGLMVLIGLAAGWFVTVRPVSLTVEAQSWDAGVCTVEHSSVVSHESDDGTTYSVDILYRWDRGRGVERSSRYSFWGGSSSGSAGKYDVIKRYPKGGEVDCWLDPETMNEAVLNREVTGQALLALVPVLFFAIGIGIWAFGRRLTRQAARLRESARLGVVPFAEDDPLLEALPRFEPSSGPTELKPSSSRWGRVLGITFAMLFWNGIVSIFVYQVWDSWERGNAEYGLMLFLVPFVLVGVGLIGGIGWALLGLSNARPILEMNRTHLHLGDELELRWRLEGKVGSIENLRIVLKGREEATYQVGTRSHTATEEFFERELVSTSGRQSAIGGQVSFPFPEKTMHSFESSHNKIVWVLELRGEIHRWPDVSEDYPLVVLPVDVANHSSKKNGWSGRS